MFLNLAHSKKKKTHVNCREKMGIICGKKSHPFENKKMLSLAKLGI